jgi:hypothetical protein
VVFGEGDKQVVEGGRKMMIKYFCAVCCVQLFPEDAKEVQDFYIDEVEQKNIRMLWCDECKNTVCEVVVFDGDLVKPCCDICDLSDTLPESERGKWRNEDTLCYCTNIPQAVGKGDYCSFWVARPYD